MSPTLISVLAFVSVSLCVAGVTQLVADCVLRDRRRIDDRFREALGEAVSQRVQSSPLFKELLIANPDAPPERVSLLTRLQTLIDQAGLPLAAMHLVVISIALPTAIAAATFLASGSLLLTSIATALAVPCPLVGVQFARQRRRAKLCRQLPDGFDVMSRALKAGQTVPSAFQLIANDFPSPIADEFTYCYEQQHLGVSQEAALRDLARRCGIMELQIFVVAMIVHARAGGNLAELLAKLATLLRKRAHVQGRVRALTGEGRMQAAVLIALPIVVFAAMYVLNREYAQILLQRPWILAGCCASQLLGAACIHKIIHFDY